MATQSVVGALPLGILICSDDKTETLIRGFTMLKTALMNNHFMGKNTMILILQSPITALSSMMHCEAYDLT